MLVFWGDGGGDINVGHALDMTLEWLHVTLPNSRCWHYDADSILERAA